MNNIHTKRIPNIRQKSTLVFFLLIAFLVSSTPATLPNASSAELAYIDNAVLDEPNGTVSVIVTADSSDTAVTAVESLGGQVTSELSLIDAVGATLNSSQINDLASMPGIVSIINNHTVTASDGPDCSDDPTACPFRPGWVTDHREKKGNVQLPVSLKYAAGLAQLPGGGFVAIAEKQYVAFANPDGSIRLLIDDLDFEKMSSPPIVTSEGGVIFMGEKQDSDDKFIIYALDYNGEVLWDYTQKDLVPGLALSPDGLYLYVLGTESKAKLYVLDAENGDLLAKAEPPTEKPGLFAQPPMVAADGTIYLQSTGKEPDKDDRFSNVIALNPADLLQDRKAFLWRFEAAFEDGDNEDLIELDMAPLLANGLIYLFSDHDKMVFALDLAAGHLLHSFTMPKALEAQPKVGPDGTLYLPADKHFYALNPDLTLRYDFISDGKFSTPVFSPDGTAAYTFAKKTIHAISTVTGETLWQIGLKGDIKSLPAIDANGNIIVGSDGKDMVIITPDGRITTRLRLDDKFGQVVSSSLPDDQMLVLVGDKDLLTIGHLSDQWNPEMVDVQPSEIKDEWEIVNTISIDIGVDLVQNSAALTGAGVTVAVVDSGVYVDKHVKDLLSSDLYATDIKEQYVGQYDFVGDGFGPRCKDDDYNAAEGFCQYDWDKSHDPYGHGSHVAGIIWSQITDASTSASMGIAPGANVVSVRVLGDDGIGTYEDVIQGIQWVVENKDNPDFEAPIRIMNLSLSAHATVPYFVDPINRAVESAWAEGIVVLAAAGNEGPEAQTITVPGNDPYVITVGAINNKRTPGYWADDELSDWSSTGPTLDGFVKPDVLAPGAQIISFMHNDGDEIARLLQDHPDYAETMSLFRMNGTSMATAVTSGVVALMLEADPTLTPDQVKFRLMTTAVPASTEDGELMYSPLKQGAGRIWAPAAVLGTGFPEDGVANAGLDINSDLAHDWILRDEAGQPIFDEEGTPVLNESELAYHYQGPIQRVTSDDGQVYLYYYEDSTDNSLLVLGGVNSSDLSWLDHDSLIAAGLTFENNSQDGISWPHADAWSSGIYSWGGGIYSWGGGIYSWGGGIYSWGGGIYSWGGGIYSWGGGIYSWGGGIYSWGGGIYSWGGGIYSWGGALDNLSGQSIGANKWVDDDRPEGFTVHVADLDGSGEWLNNAQWQQSVTITVRDEYQSRIEGATITGTWSNSGGETSCTTAVNGECTLNSALLAVGVSNTTYTVTGINHETLAYVAADNIDLEGDTNGTSITGIRPVHPTVHVSDIDATSTWINSSQWSLEYVITAVDDQSSPVADATITAKWSKGLNGTFTCLTNSNGQCVVTGDAVDDNIDEVELEILGINHWLLNYEKDDNNDADGDSNGSKLAIEPPAYRPSLHVADLDAVTEWVSSSEWHTDITVTVQDDLSQPVANAAVSGIWKSGLSGSFNCTTDISGQCTIPAGNLVVDDIDELKLEITNVAHPMLYYVDDDNDDPDSDSNGTAMTVEPPDYRPGMHINDLTGSASWLNSSEWLVTITFTVLDDNQQPVVGAAVTSKWTKGLAGNVTCTTDNNGQCTVSGNVPADQSKAQLEVLSVTHSMLVNNGDTDSISVARP